MRAESKVHPLPDGYLMAVCEKVSTPFSWWNTVFMNHNDYEKGTNALLTHELGHLRLHHSADVLLVELLTALQWFNPAMWMLRADLRTIHEYEADQQVISHGFNDIQASCETKTDYQTKEESALILKVKDGKDCLAVKVPVGAFYSWIVNGKLAERGIVEEDGNWNVYTPVEDCVFMLDGKEIR